MRNFLYRIVSWSLPPSAFFQLTSTFRRFSFSPFQLSIHRQVSFPLWGQQLRSVTVIAFRSFPETPRGQFYWKQSLAWTRKIALTVVSLSANFFLYRQVFFTKQVERNQLEPWYRGSYVRRIHLVVLGSKLFGTPVRCMNDIISLLCEWYHLIRPILL